MQSVRFETGLLAPLPKHLQGSACSLCDKMQAVWHLRGDDLNPVCSLCVLYSVDWDGKSPLQLQAYMAAVEEAKGVKFARGPDGLLCDIHAANALITGLVTVSRLGPAIGR
jgi:hypothetical protein